MNVAVVVQRYGEEVCGGAELLCRQVVEHMTRHWDIEVLTSCAQDSETWANAYPAGVVDVSGVTVRRFPVEHPRGGLEMGKLTDRVFFGSASRQEEVDWIIAQGPYSKALLEFLRTDGDRYDLVIFFTYLYAPTVFGIPLLRGKCALVPTAHDEPPIYMRIFRDVFCGVNALLFSTSAEQAFVNRLFGTASVYQDIVGVGVERPPGSNSRRFLAKHAAELEGSPFILYAGRIEEWKGCPTLFKHFMRFREEVPECPVKLVMIGSKVMDIPEHPDIIHPGFVSDREKVDAFAAASLIVQSSPYESLSMVTLEAWQLEKPVLVNGECEVLRDQCIRSNGGLWYQCFEEFREELKVLLNEPALRARLGTSGRHFVEHNYSWDVIERKYLRAAARILNRDEADVCCPREEPAGTRQKNAGRVKSIA
jgi:glycosyltransferase involved in cell wall biosynthesis